MDEREFMRELYMLARTFVRGEIVYRDRLRAIDGNCRDRRARLVYYPGDRLEAFDLGLFGQPVAIYNRQTMNAELADPRAIPAVIRTFCRLLGQEMPSFWAVDEALKEEAPPWWHEEFDNSPRV